MFNTFLTNILNSYLGEIVEDLDLDNLGSGALHGDILLIDLKLRPDCLSVLELPLEVKFGSIGKLSLKIPWTSLASSPVTLNIQVNSLFSLNRVSNVLSQNCKPTNFRHSIPTIYRNISRLQSL